MAGKPLVHVVELDHIVLVVRDVETSLAFYCGVLGLEAERLEEYRAGKVRFPSVRVSADTIIDMFATADAPPGRNMDHFCLVIEKTDMIGLTANLKARGVPIESGPGRRWGARGTGESVYVLDPNGNKVELRRY